MLGVFSTGASWHRSCYINHAAAVSTAGTDGVGKGQLSAVMSCSKPPYTHPLKKCAMSTSWRPSSTNLLENIVAYLSFGHQAAGIRVYSAQFHFQVICCSLQSLWLTAVATPSGPIPAIFPIFNKCWWNPSRPWGCIQPLCTVKLGLFSNVPLCRCFFFFNVRCVWLRFPWCSVMCWSRNLMDMCWCTFRNLSTSLTWLISNVTQSFWFHVNTTEKCWFLRNETDAALVFSINVSPTDEKAEFSIKADQRGRAAKSLYSPFLCGSPLAARQPHHYRPGHWVTTHICSVSITSCVIWIPFTLAAPHPTAPQLEPRYRNRL